MQRFLQVSCQLCKIAVKRERLGSPVCSLQNAKVNLPKHTSKHICCTGNADKRYEEADAQVQRRQAQAILVL
ncbi:hypothetical protein WJX77_006605 [Trebouxia sp. C0004]